MYAIVANGIKGIFDKDEFDIISSIYPYPKFAKVSSIEEGMEFLDRYKRKDYGSSINVYGDTDTLNGYATLTYFIKEDALLCNLDTRRLGDVYLSNKNIPNLHIENRRNNIRIKNTKLLLNNNLISDHCIAINYLLNIIGDIIDVNIVVPDISIYLALTKYSGTNYLIKSCKESISDRLGGISYTVKGF